MKPKFPEFITNTYTDHHEVLRDTGLFLSGLGISFSTIGFVGEFPIVGGVGAAVTAIGIFLTVRQSTPTDATARDTEKQIRNWNMDKDFEQMLNDDKKAKDDGNGPAL